MISSKEFRQLSLEEQSELTKSDLSDWEIWTYDNLRITNEDLSNKATHSKLKELSKLLKDFDYTYVWSDSGIDYKRGKQQEDDIKKLKDEIGKKGQEMWLKFLKDKKLMEVNGRMVCESRDDISPSTRASIKKYMKELEKLCKRHNWHWMYEKDDGKFKHGQFIEQSIREIVIEVKELGSMEGFDLYQKFALKNGIKINYFKESKESGIYDYQRYYHSKMKKWGIKDVDELNPEERQKFSDEVDRDWHGGEKVKSNIPEHKSLFPEMANVSRKGSLDYAIREVGEKSLTASTFGDSGNLYPEHLVPNWSPPSENRKRRLK
jgi:nicotinamidase-related amidase